MSACPNCGGGGEVRHGEGALSYVTLCTDPACIERRRDAWDPDELRVHLDLLADALQPDTALEHIDVLSRAALTPSTETESSDA